MVRLNNRWHVSSHDGRVEVAPVTELKDTERSKANARLIRTAPELLAALKATERELSAWHHWRAQSEGYTESDGYRETAAILRRARAAIEASGGGK